MDQASVPSGQVPLGKVEKPRQRTWDEVLAHEVGEYFSYEPRVPSMNSEGGARSDPFGRVHQYSGGAGHYFMASVYDRLKEADKFMPYVCDGKREQPSASMTLRAAYGTNAAKYDDSAPRGARFLKMAQSAYAEAASRVGKRKPENRMDQVLRRFDLVFSGLMVSFPSDEDD